MKERFYRTGGLQAQKLISGPSRPPLLILFYLLAIDKNIVELTKREQSILGWTWGLGGHYRTEEQHRMNVRTPECGNYSTTCRQHSIRPTNQILNRFREIMSSTPGVCDLYRSHTSRLIIDARRHARRRCGSLPETE